MKHYSEKALQRKARHDAERANERMAKRAGKIIATQRNKAKRASKSAPLVIKNLDGEVIKVHPEGKIPKPLSSRQRWFIKKLRAEMGIEIDTFPETAREGSRVIEMLLQRKGMIEREAIRVSRPAPARKEYRRADGSAG